MQHAIFGMSTGNVYFYNIFTRQLSHHRLSRQTLMKVDCKINSIDFHPNKMHRLLIYYNLSALKIYSINKHQIIRSVTDKLFLAAKFIKADLGEVLILAIL